VSQVSTLPKLNLASTVDDAEFLVVLSRLVPHEGHTVVGRLDELLPAATPEKRPAEALALPAKRP